MTDVIVTGAAGLIGYEIASQLLEKGYKVFGVDSLIKGGEEDLDFLANRYPDKFRWLKGDLVDPTTVELLPREVSSVVHMAAIVGVAYVNEHPYTTIRTNLLSTLNLFDWCKGNNIKSIVFASSSENYASTVTAGIAPLPTPENVLLSIDDITLPRWSYAASKIGGESALFSLSCECGIDVPLVIRFHNVYGERMPPTHVIPEFLDRCRQKMDPFPIYGIDATRSFLHVTDAARAVIKLWEGSESGVVNVGSGTEVKVRELAETVFDVTGFHPKVEEHSAPPGSVKRRVPDISRLQSIGFEESISLREGIKRCWDYLLSS
ncbi:MAG: NAD-dependent epimerase/dehydratase family protein [Candidatus Dadabacteria bacterium]|nr:MAG: NAD-dependent epimerase/dehydratase family protein [Candidatus Dadabacteria bacterium]